MRGSRRWLLLGLLCLLAPGVALAQDPRVIQVQQRLAALGYEVGTIDGLLGTRTRQALQAFQRDRGLPPTGSLDAATLQALGLAAPPAAPPAPREASPVRVVVDFLRFYDAQPARALPYLSPAFLGGMTAREWIAHTNAWQQQQAYELLAWRVEHVERTETQATVQVQTQVRVGGETRWQRETFTLVHVAERGWLITARHVSPLAQPPAGS
ncbi:MAG: hypothetical protein KatS3mg131_1230 [Candidatus Tectimicrobiota bacterium]|nr:MAG: hypothetical protein KatS3mg131_1230 [Candidatus Tectomicrobia bacterium]